MRYLPKSDAERRQMLAEIGAASIDDLFAIIPAEYRLDRDLDVPRQQAESEIVDYFRAAGAEERHRLRELSGRGRLSPLPAGDHRRAGAARRVPHQLHALPGRDHAGHAAGHLRVPDHDRRADRHGRGQRQHVRRVHRRGGGGDDGGARHGPPQGRGGVDGASRVPRGAGHLRAASGTAGDARWLRRRNRARRSGRAGRCGDRRDRGRAGAEPELLRRDRGHSGDCGDRAREGRAADCVDCRSGFAGHRAAAGRGRHRRAWRRSRSAWRSAMAGRSAA